MSSDSDSEDDGQIKQFLEAADTSLLNNAMFQKKDDQVAVCNDMKEPKTDLPKSQRYIIEDTENSGIDFHLPESMQRHLAKKFSEISDTFYEFYDVSKNNLPKQKTKFKNRVKLLKDSDCFVNSYEDFEYETSGPTKKPVIKRRMVDEQAAPDATEDILKSVAIDGNFILSGQDVKKWAKKKERKNKVFYYKLASSGVCHAKEEINEFTDLRTKNKWNENKIKKFRKSQKFV